jgi:hypothetical protein
MRASFLRCPIDVLTMADTIELAGRANRSQRLQNIALNVAKFVSMRFDPVLAVWPAHASRFLIGAVKPFEPEIRNESRRVGG